MSKYSDNATVGGQVLAHRVRMMRQIWNIVWLVGRCNFVLMFFGYMLFRWKLNDIWNYLCLLKGCWRAGMSSNFLPHSLFSNSYFGSEVVIANGFPITPSLQIQLSWPSKISLKPPCFLVLS